MGEKPVTANTAYAYADRDTDGMAPRLSPTSSAR